MSVLTLPVSPARQHEIRAALEASDKALEELLRQAVSAFTDSRASAFPIFSSHYRDLSMAYLHAVEIMLDRPGLSQVLGEAIDDGTCDIPALCLLARRGVPAGPDAA